jgi:hypothetical protein
VRGKRRAKSESRAAFPPRPVPGSARGRPKKLVDPPTRRLRQPPTGRQHQRQLRCAGSRRQKPRSPHQVLPRRCAPSQNIRAGNVIAGPHLASACGSVTGCSVRS